MVQLNPSKENFNILSKQSISRKLIPIYLELPLSEFPNLTPVALLDHFKNKGDYVLLESVKNGRFSYACFDPFMTFKSKGNSIELIFNNEKKLFYGNPLNKLKQIIRKYQISRTKDLPLFFSGAIGYLGYDIVHFIEKLPKTTIDDLSLPDCYFIFPRLIFAFDHEERLLKIITLTKNNLVDYDKTTTKLNNIYNQLINVNIEILDSTNYQKILKNRKRITLKDIKSNFTAEEYKTAIKKAKEYIFAGDSFQIKLSHPF